MTGSGWDGQTVLVVGASGYLGRSVVERLRKSDRPGPDHVVGTYCSRSGPTASEQFDFWTDDVGDLLAEYAVDTVVYAAANEYGGDVDTGDTEAGGTFEERAALFARRCADRRVVYMSSAAVFDGTDSQYTESDPRSPRDDYGRRLVTFEDAFAQHCDDLAILRTSYLFGFSTGSLDQRLARTRDALDRGESVAYFTDMYKSPVLVTEAAETIGALVAGDVTGPVHVPTPRVSVYDFHCAAMRALGYDTGPIEAERIPPDMDVAPDTSLASEHFADLVDFAPSTVDSGLRSQIDDSPE